MYIGYITLESWLDVVYPEQPVFACLVTEPGQSSRNGQRRDILAILVAQAEGDLIHYCRLPVSELQYVGDSPHNNHKQYLQLANQAWAIVLKWLTDQKLIVKQGVVAFPNNIKLLDGFAGFLKYDPQAVEYYQSSPPPELYQSTP